MMQREVGDRSFPIWLIGDSNPEEWECDLEAPFDPRHSARHNIWTAVIDVVQDRVFRAHRARIDTSRLYIRNAIAKAKDKPRGKDVIWPEDVTAEVAKLRDLVGECKPVFLFSFGAFSAEFVRRAMTQGPPRRYGHWGARNAGDAFRAQIAGFRPDAVNWLPLLHISISAGRFLSSHNQFCGRDGANYFDCVGNDLARVMIEHADVLPIWMP